VHPRIVATEIIQRKNPIINGGGDGIKLLPEPATIDEPVEWAMEDREYDASGLPDVELCQWKGTLRNGHYYLFVLMGKYIDTELPVKRIDLTYIIEVTDLNNLESRYRLDIDNKLLRSLLVDKSRK
jgi:hypothetical protein